MENIAQNLRDAADRIERQGLAGFTRHFCTGAIGANLQKYYQGPVCALGAFEEYGMEAERFPRTLATLAQHINKPGESVGHIIADWSNAIAMRLTYGDSRGTLYATAQGTPFKASPEAAAEVAKTMRELADTLDPRDTRDAQTLINNALAKRVEKSEATREPVMA